MARCILGSVVVCLVSSLCFATVTTVAYEGFDYASGSPLATDASTGQSGGTGWSGNWRLTYYDGQLKTYAPGYTYTDLSTTGGYIGFGTSGSQGISQAYRALPSMQDSNIVYVQCLFFSSVFGTGGTPQLRLENSTLGTSGGMGIFDVPADKLAIASGDDLAQSDVSYDTTAHLMVWQIDYQNTTSKLWIDPDLSTFDYESPAATADSSGAFAPEFDGLSIYFRNGSGLDEISVFAIPEPATMSVLALGGLAVCLRRRKA